MLQRPVPSPAQVASDLARLRAVVEARCAQLKSAAAARAGEQHASGSADDFSTDESFKWDRECEEALHAVITNGLATGPTCVAARGPWRLRLLTLTRRPP